MDYGGTAHTGGYYNLWMMAKLDKNWGTSPQESTTAGSSGKGWGASPQESTTAGSPGKGWGASPQESTTAGNSGKGWGASPQESMAGNVKKGKAGCGDAPVYSFYILDGVTFKVKRLISDQSGEAIIFEVENDGNVYVLKLYRRNVIPNHEVLQHIMELRGNGLLVDIFAHGKWHDEMGGGDYHYEVMEFCGGGSLANANVYGNEAKLREIATRMASAIDFAHKHGVLHRDVKPANFLYVDKEQSRFVLTDWGLAKTLDKDKRTQTDAGRTKIYAAPEMYTYIPGTPTYVGPKADFFSMGMALLALWMGEGKLLADETKLVHDKQEETLPYPHRGEMSDHTLGLIKALTRRNPEMRAGFDDIVRWAKGENIYKEKSDDELPDFKIVFNATAGLIAHTPKELSGMMWDNRDLAMKYLYSDKLAGWFRDIKRPELAMEMEDITEHRFPGNRKGGLYAACLTLNPDMPFPFVTDGKRVPVHTLEELADCFVDGRLRAGHVPGMASETFLMWAATRDAALAGKAMKVKGAWEILYALLPDRGFDFKRLKDSRLSTPEQLARQIVDEISQKENSSELVACLNAKFLDSRLYAYLSSKGIYNKQLDWIVYCLDLDSADNKRKFVPYTLRMAQLKIAAGLLGSVPPLTIGEETFHTPSDVEKIDESSYSDAEQDIIADWLSLFYQEDPYADYKKKSYLDRTDEYGDMIEFLPRCSYMQQSEDASLDLAATLQVHDQFWRKVKIWRWIGGILGFAPLLLVCLAGIGVAITHGTPDFSEVLAPTAHFIGAGLGIIVFLSMLGDDYGIIFSGGAGLACYVAVKLAFAFLGMIVPWLIIGLMFIILFFMGKKLFIGERKFVEDQYTDLSWDEAVKRYMVGIRFNSIDKVFPMDVPDDYPMCLIEESSERAALELPKVRRSALVMFFIAAIGGFLCWLSVKGFAERAHTPVAAVQIKGQFEGDVEGTPATVNFERIGKDGLKAQMIIDYQSGQTRQNMIASSAGSFPILLYKEGNKEIYFRIDTLYAKESGQVAEGVYLNSKKNLRKVKIHKK